MANNNDYSLCKVCVIGVGKQALEDHIPAFREAKKARLVSLVDSDLRVVKKWSQKLGIPGFTDISQAIKAERPDFAIVAVPHDQYFRIIKLLAKNKIHILKEKPLAVDFKEAKEIERLVNKAGIQLMVTLQRRFNPIYTTFSQLMNQIGRHYFVEAKYTIFIDNPEDGWRGKKKIAGGGCIIDMGYHLIDLLIWYFGLPNEILAECGSLAKPSKNYDAEDTAVITFRYAESIFGTLILSRFMSPKTEYLKLIGSKGIVTVKRGELVRTDMLGEIKEHLSRKKGWTAAATAQVEYFCDVINNKRINIGSPEVHLQHMAFIEACYRSQKLGKYINPFEILYEND